VQPLFAGGSILFNREATLARLDQALVGYRKAILSGLAEVADALNTYQSSGEVLQVQTRRVESAREALRLADLRYRAGTTSFIEVLDAQRQLFSAETDQVQNLLERRTALSRVYLALGGGWAEIKSTNEPAVTRN
jgi:multidrug efflux system outer membrane protein